MERKRERRVRLLRVVHDVEGALEAGAQLVRRRQADEARQLRPVVARRRARQDVDVELAQRLAEQTVGQAQRERVQRAAVQRQTRRVLGQFLFSTPRMNTSLEDVTRSKADALISGGSVRNEWRARPGAMPGGPDGTGRRP